MFPVYSKVIKWLHNLIYVTGKLNIYIQFIFIERADVEAETPILWPPDVKSWLISKDPDAGKDWRWEEEGTTEDEMVGWHHWLNGHEFGWTPGVGDWEAGLPCCSPWGCKELDMTEQLNWTEYIYKDLYEAEYIYIKEYVAGCQIIY